MNILKRNIAPISAEAWEEIDSTAKDVLLNILSARRVLKVNGPKGWDYAALPEGRIKKGDEAKDNGGVGTGIYKVKPLVEARASFELNKWELDNIERGAKDVELDSLEEACENIAVFEEEAIYNGYEKGKIKGLVKSAGHKKELGKDGNEILKAVGEGVYTLKNSYVDGPYNLIVSSDAFDRINTVYEGAYLINLIEKIIGGKVIRSKVVKGAIMIPYKDEDLEFTVGQDLAVGFEGETEKTVKLFITESFTLRVLDENKIIAYSL